MRRSPSYSLGPRRGGFTIIELLAALTVLSILLIGAWRLLDASWKSYDNLVWQNKVNMEARQALDSVCEIVRVAGINKDMVSPTAFSFATMQVADYSIANVLGFDLPGLGGGYLFYPEVGPHNYLRDASARMVSEHVKDIAFEYEYRVPTSAGARDVWTSQRVSSIADNPALAYLVHTVHVSVTAEVQPYGAGGPTYTRTLRSAVRLRAPYNNAAPPTQYKTI